MLPLPFLSVSFSTNRPFWFMLLELARHHARHTLNNPLFNPALDACLVIACMHVRMHGCMCAASLRCHRALSAARAPAHHGACHVQQRPRAGPDQRQRRHRQGRGEGWVMEERRGKRAVFVVVTTTTFVVGRAMTGQRGGGTARQ